MSENKGMKPSASIAENSVLAKEKRGFPFKKVFFALLIVIIIFTIVLIAINSVVTSYFNKITIFDGKWELDVEKMNSMEIYQDNRAYFTKNEALHEVYHAALLNFAQASSDMRYSETVFNYAIFGTDQFDSAEENASADIVMLVSVDEEREEVTYLTFESRTLVYIPGVGVGPMCHAYMLGGPQLLANTLELNIGIQLDGFVDLNMAAFSEFISAFGNIEINGDKQLVKDINEYIVEFDESKGLTGDRATKSVKLVNGKIELDGQQTLAYLRRAGDKKAALANSILSQLTSKIVDRGVGGVMSVLDIALEKMTVSMLREDAGALITIGLSVFESIDMVPVGNMPGRETVLGGSAVTCDYQAERAAVIKNLYH